MATEFFRVRGMSERKNTIFKPREVQNIKIIIIVAVYQPQL